MLSCDSKKTLFPVHLGKGMNLKVSPEDIEGIL